MTNIAEDVPSHGESDEQNATSNTRNADEANAQPDKERPRPPAGDGGELAAKRDDHLVPEADAKTHATPLPSVPFEDDSSQAVLHEGGEPDVLLDVPEIKVDEISLKVEDLNAYVALAARVGNLVALDVGAQVHLGKLDLTIKGVRAQALLKVRLEKVYAILARTLTTIDRNPELLASLLRPIGETVAAVGRTVEETVPPLSEALGRTVEKTVPQLGEAVGRTVEKTVPPLGQAIGTTVEKTVPPLGQAIGTTVEKTVPPLGQAVGITVEKTVPPLGQAVGATVEKTVPPLGQAVGTTVETTVPPLGQTVSTTVEKTVPEAARVVGTTVESTVPELTSSVSNTDEQNAPVDEAARTTAEHGSAAEKTEHDVPATPADVERPMSNVGHRLADRARHALGTARHIARIPRRGTSAARHATRRILGLEARESK